MVVTFLLLQRRMESNKGRSCRPVEKEPVAGAGCRSVCHSLRAANEKKERPARTAGDERRAHTIRLLIFPYPFCVAPYGGSPLLMYRKHRSRPTYDEKDVHRMWIRFFMKRNDSTRDARESVRHQNSIVMRCKENFPPVSAPPAHKRHKQGRREAATQIFHGHAGKPREGCGSAPAYFTVSTAFESARNEQNHFAWCVNPHCLKTNSRALVQLPAHWNGARPRRGEI